MVLSIINTYGDIFLSFWGVMTSGSHAWEHFFHVSLDLHSYDLHKHKSHRYETLTNRDITGIMRIRTIVSFTTISSYEIPARDRNIKRKTNH